MYPLMIGLDLKLNLFVPFPMLGTDPNILLNWIQRDEVDDGNGFEGVEFSRCTHLAIAVVAALEYLKGVLLADCLRR
jgi:hypothetical protein